MRKNSNQANVDDHVLIFLYRELLVPWELEFHHQQFLMPRKKEGFKAFCIENSIVIESQMSSISLKRNMNTFTSASKKLNGLFRIAQSGTGYGKTRKLYTIPKSLLYHLRNSVAHASFGSRKSGGISFIYFEGSYRGKLKIQARIQEELLIEFVKNLVSTRVAK